MLIGETSRLTLRRVEAADADFILELVNDPDWLRFIGDKNVRTVDDARAYIAREMLSSYERLDYGLYLVQLTDGAIPIGLCGLKKRDGLEHPDIGFAFQPDYRGKGLAFESCARVLQHARDDLLLRQVLAITSLDNVRSIALLFKLGMTFERLITLPGSMAQLRLFAISLRV